MGTAAGQTVTRVIAAIVKEGGVMGLFTGVKQRVVGVGAVGLGLGLGVWREEGSSSGKNLHVSLLTLLTLL